MSVWDSIANPVQVLHSANSVKALKELGAIWLQMYTKLTSNMPFTAIYFNNQKHCISSLSYSSL